MTKLFLIISLLVSLLCIAFTAMPLWLGLLMLPLCFVALLLPMVAMIVIAAARADTLKPIEKVSSLSRLCCAAIADLLCTLGMLDTGLSGFDKLPEDGPVLFVSNHRSAADPMILYHYLRKRHLAFISKPSNMALPFLGKMAYGAGFLAIDRENDRKALKTILTAAGYLKNNICSVGIYPEGTRSRDGELLPFHAGSFKIAQKGNAPVAVICTYGTEKVFSNLKRLRRSKLQLDMLELIDSSRVQSMSSSELADYSRELIRERIEMLDRQREEKA